LGASWHNVTDARRVIGLGPLFASMLLVAAPIPATAQQNQRGGLLGGIINSITASNAREEWKKVDTKLLECFNGSGASPEELAQKGIGPSDPNVQDFFKRCQVENKARDEWNKLDPKLTECFSQKANLSLDVLIQQGRGPFDQNVQQALDQCRAAISQRAAQQSAYSKMPDGYYFISRQPPLPAMKACVLPHADNKYMMELLRDAQKQLAPRFPSSQIPANTITSVIQKKDMREIFEDFSDCGIIIVTKQELVFVLDGVMPGTTIGMRFLFNQLTDKGGTYTYKVSDVAMDRSDINRVISEIEAAQKAERERLAAEARKAEEARKAAEDAARAEAARLVEQRNREAEAQADQQKKQDADRGRRYAELMASLNEAEKAIFKGSQYVVLINSLSEKLTRNLSGSLVSVSSSATCLLTMQNANIISNVMKTNYGGIQLGDARLCQSNPATTPDLVLVDAGHLAPQIFDNVRGILGLIRDGKLELFETLPSDKVGKMLADAAAKISADESRRKAEQARWQSEENARLAAEEDKRRANDPLTPPDFSDRSAVYNSMLKMGRAMGAGLAFYPGTQIASAAQVGMQMCGEWMKDMQNRDTREMAWSQCAGWFRQYKSALDQRH